MTVHCVMVRPKGNASQEKAGKQRVKLNNYDMKSK